MKQTSGRLRRAYDTDLTDRQWAFIAQLIPPPKPGGRPRTTDTREVVNAIFYLLKSGCSWRMLPHDLPDWEKVYYYFAAWKKDGTWKRIHDRLRDQVRLKAGKKAKPSAAIIDSQSVKTTQKRGARGYDASKKVKGRKRHLAVDTLGLLLAVVVHSGTTQDRDGAKYVLKRLLKYFPDIQLIWADGGYAGKLIAWALDICGYTLEIVRRSEDTRGFKIVPKRWIVERTFSWFNHYRRLSKDYEFDPKTSEAMLHIAMIHIMIRRLA
ncbi:MAG: IS5 family transposase [Candidatus Melainabacteria bacterium]|nr:IS5 family transposase [Candidatus Melainabacteria bacterium]